MSNRSSSHKHGFASIHILRKKSKLRKRKNKTLARERRNERQSLLAQKYQEALAQIT